MQFKFFFFAIIFAFNFTIIAQRKSAQIVGKWETVEIKNQVGYQIEFYSNNEFIYRRVLIADYKYKLIKNMLITHLTKNYPRKRVIIDTSYVRIKNDTLFRSYNRLGWKDTAKMIRDNKYKKIDKNNKILGRWIWVYPAGDTAISTFYNNGIWHFFVPQDKIKGKYAVKNDTLILQYTQGKKQIYIFKIEGKLFELKDLKTRNQILYRRID